MLHDIFTKNKQHVFAISLVAFSVFIYYEKREIVSEYVGLSTTTSEFNIVSTSLGSIRGYLKYSRDGKPYWSFKSIPYAKPPVNRRRFQQPEPLETFGDSIVGTDAFPSPCVQYDNLLRKHLGSEDCLYMNIFVPHENRTARDKTSGLPVMVYIHGGSFLFGSSELYGPDYFMDEEVILITLHYRLGLLGFLKTDVIRGNNGLKDILMALKFVKRVIGYFGGDASRVTLFGESAGSSAVHHLIMSEKIKGLVTNAIMQSGSAHATWSFVTSRVNITSLKCESNDLPCLQKLPAQAFSKFHEHHEEFWSEKIGPTLEPLDDPDAVVTRLPHENHVKNVPFIAGVVPNEGCILAHAILNNMDKVNRDWNVMNTVLDVYNATEKLKSIRKEYFGESYPQLTVDDLKTITKLVTERHFYSPLQKLIKSNYTGGSKNYLYYFNYSSAETSMGMGHIIRTKLLPILPAEASLALKMISYQIQAFLGMSDDFGICHADELRYQFMQTPLLKIVKGSSDYAFSKYFVKLWTSFAQSGDVPQEWQSLTDGKLALEISAGSKPVLVEDFMDMNKIRFWDMLNNYS